MNRQARYKFLVILTLIKKSFRHPFALMGVSFLIFSFFYGPLIGFNVKFQTDVSGDFKIDYSKELSANLYITSDLRSKDSIKVSCGVGEAYNTSNIGMVLVARVHFNQYLSQINNYWTTYLNSNKTLEDNNTFKFLCENQSDWLVASSLLNIIGNSSSHNMDAEYTASKNLNAVFTVLLLEWQNSTSIKGINLSVVIKRTRSSEFLIVGSFTFLAITLIVSSFLLTYKDQVSITNEK